MKKSILNLGRTLNKEEQKGINGGLVDKIIESCDPRNSGAYPIGSKSCECLAQGKFWNYECDRCETPGEYYFDDGQCGQIIFP